MALIGSLTTTGSMSSTVVDEARWKVANDDGTSPGSVSLVVQAGDFGNAHQRNASGSIIFVGKDGGSTNKAGSIVSKPYTNQDLIFSSSQSHADIRFAVNDNGSNFNLMTMTSGRSGGGLSGFRKPKVFITDTSAGYDKDVTVQYRGGGLLTVSTQTDQVGIQIIHTGTATEKAFEVKKHTGGAGGNDTSSLFSIGHGETVVNNDSIDHDFRVESNGQTNMLYVDGGNDRVGIGNNAPMGALDINDMSQTYALVLRRNDNSGVATSFSAVTMGGQAQTYFTGTNGKFLFYGGKDSNPDAQVYITGKAQASNPGDSRIWFSTLANNGSTQTDVWYTGYDRGDSKFMIGESSTWGTNQVFTSDGDEIVLNDSSNDVDFRVESTDKTHAIFMDGTNGKVAFGDNTDTNLSSLPYVTIAKTLTDKWDSELGSSNTLDHMDLLIRNKSNIERTFAALAFDPGTEVDSDSIGAAIIAERDGSAHADSTKHDTNLLFCTNYSGDDDLSERLRIAHDGQLYSSRDVGARLNLIRNDSVIGSNNAIGTIAFLGKEDTSGMHTAIVSGTMMESAKIQAVSEASMAAGDSPSQLRFFTTPDGSATATEKLRLTAAGNIYNYTYDEKASLYLSRVETGDNTIGSGDELGFLAFRASENGSDYAQIGGITVQTTEAFAYNSAHGSKFRFWMTPDGATSNVNVANLDGSGNLDVAGYFQAGGATTLKGATDLNANIMSDKSMNFFVDYDSDNTDSEFAWYNHSSTKLMYLTDDGDLWLDSSSPSITLNCDSNTEATDGALYFIKEDTDIDDNNEIGTIMWRSKIEGGTARTAGSIKILAYGDHSDSDSAGEMRFYLTPDASTSPTESVRIRTGDNNMMFLDGNVSEDSIFTEGHRYIENGSDITYSDACVLVDGKLERSSSPKQKNVCGIAWFKTHQSRVDMGFGSLARHNEDDDGNKTFIRFRTQLDSLGNRYNRGKFEEGDTVVADDYSKMWKVASLGDSRQEADDSSTQPDLAGFKVCNEGGAIEAGDLLCTSSTAGYLMKQDDDIIHGYTVGKAMEDVTFDENGQASGIYGYIYCG